MQQVIISRHRGALEWLAKYLYPEEHAAIIKDGALEWHTIGLEPESPEFGCYRSIPVVQMATPDSLRSKIVYGNLPNHLQCQAVQVCVIEFSGTPPRGQEYSLEDMEKAGAHLSKYKVLDEKGMNWLLTLQERPAPY